MKADEMDILSALVLEDGRTWADAATPVQWSDACAICKGDVPYHAITRARGYSKTADNAGVAVAAAIAAPAGSRLYWLAADQGQGRLALDSIAGYQERTPLIRREIAVQSQRVVIPATGTVLELLAADAASAWGLRPYMAFVDELAQWPETMNARRLFEAVTSAMLKVLGARLVVMTTAGSPSHFAAKFYESARSSDLWRVSETLGPAPWSDPAMLAEQKARLPASVYDQLFENLWTEADDAFLDSAALDQAFTLDGPATERKDARKYFAGLDLGHVKDRTAFAVGHRDGESVHLDLMHVWQGSRKRPVDFGDVERFVREMHERFRFELWADPWQALSVLQRLRQGGIRAHEFTFSTSTKQKLASTLLQAVNDGTLALYDAPGLKDELLALRVKQTASGAWTFDHATGAHDDRAMALAMVAVAAIGSRRGFQIETGPNLWEGPYIASDPPVAQRLGTRHNESEHHRRWAQRNYCYECAAEWEGQHGDAFARRPGN